MAPLSRLSERDLQSILSQTSSLWDELRGRRIFLTGGTGFFGCWLVESFCHLNRDLDLGAKITVLTRNPKAFAEKCPHLAIDPAVSLHAGDVRDFIFPDGEFTYVIHAATEARARQATDAPLEMLSTMVSGTQRTLEFAATHGTQKFLLTSSGAVYGPQPAELTHVPETYRGAPNPLNAAHVYGRGQTNIGAFVRHLSKEVGDMEVQDCALLGLLRTPSFLWMNTSPSATSSEMFLREGLFKYRAMALPVGPIYMPPISPLGCGLYCFALQRWNQSMLDRPTMSVFWS